jgi:hypothetical protein
VSDPYVFTPAKIARRGLETGPAAKCMEVVSTTGGHLAWCANPKDKRSPEHRPPINEQR